MLAGPLGTLPAQMTILAQAKLAVDRLDQFFSEGQLPFRRGHLSGNRADASFVLIFPAEVPDFVTSIRSKKVVAESASPRLAIEKGRFRWNTVDATTANENDPLRFELGELSIEFPEGEVSPESGPTHTWDA